MKKPTAVVLALLVVLSAGVALAATSPLSDGDPTFDDVSTDEGTVTDSGTIDLLSNIDKTSELEGTPQHSWVTKTKDADNGDFDEWKLQGQESNGRYGVVDFGDYENPEGATYQFDINVYLGSNTQIAFFDGSEKFKTFTASNNDGGDHSFTYTPDDGNLDLRVRFDADSAGGSYNDAYLRPKNALDNPELLVDITGDALSGQATTNYYDLSNMTEAGNFTTTMATDGPNSQVDLGIQRQFDGKVICSINSVEGQTLNLNQQCSFDPTNPDNGDLRFLFNFSRSAAGDTSDSLDSYSFEYESATDPPEIQSTSAVVSGLKTDSDNVTSSVDTTDTFTVEDVTNNVEEVRWYVDGQLEKQDDSVSGDGPFSFDHTWQNTGDRTVTVEVYDAEGQRDTHSWNVEVDEVAITGRDSYSVASGRVFEVTQTFGWSGTGDIQVRLNIDDTDAVTVVSGPETIQVANGDSVTWEFVVDAPANYNGQPISITASADSGRYQTTQPLTLSVTSDSGFLAGGDQGLVERLKGLALPVGITALGLLGAAAYFGTGSVVATLTGLAGKAVGAVKTGVSALVGVVR
ncbi:hypothetical protein [Haloglomus salinum]|uniref:hypothetical protein n=1 Tax=Haloglomus salinum TaxID=2962673 RepID=UPI0020CA0D4C|nr:hypothetical protein [Haloglomus salinum]